MLDKVKKRIKHFSKGYHDERRAKETAERQKEEAITYAQKLVEENKKLKGSVNQSHNTLIESAKKGCKSNGISLHSSNKIHNLLLGNSFVILLIALVKAPK